ncbi:hypothetical protein KQI52_06525 [bacterium]|nr:hypothetical protein [bacterium]
MKRSRHISNLFIGHGARVFAVATLAVFLVSAGCLMEPDRNNPADPNSPEYNDDGMIRFEVYDRDNQPLENASVRLQGYDNAQFTNENGIAMFEIAHDEVFYTVDRAGYVPKSNQVLVQARKTTTEEIRLNGEPFIDSVRVNTTMKEDVAGTFQYGYQCRVYVGDYDSIEDLTELRYYPPEANSPKSVIAEPEIFIDEVVSDTSKDLINLIGQEFRFVLYDEESDTAEVRETLNTHLFYKWLASDMVPIGPHEYEIGNMEFTWANNTSPRHLLYAPNKYRLQIYQRQNSISSFIDTTVVFDFSYAQSTADFTILITQEDGFTDGQTHWWQLTMYDLSGNLVRSPRLEFIPSPDIIGD